MNLTIKLPDEDVPALKAKATALGISAEHMLCKFWNRCRNGFGNRGRAPGKPDWISFPWMRLTRRFGRQGKPGVKPSRSPAHDPGCRR
jgi:hypothetical protein